MKTEKDKLSRIEILGRLLSKEIGAKNVTNLSEETTTCVLNLSPSKESFHYSLYIKNQDQNENSTWEHLSFDIKQSMNLSYFNYNDVDCLQWFTKTTVYFLEILIDDLNERNKNNFWKVLEQCLCSIVNNIPIERASIQVKKNSKKYVKYLGIVQDLGTHVDQMIKQLEENNKKELLEVKLITEFKNLQITPPKLDTILNLNVAKKIFQTQGELYNYDTNKEELVILNNGSKVNLSVYHLDSQKFDYALCTETLNNDLLISIDKITEQINGQIMDNENSKFFCWITSKCYTNIIGNCLGFLFDSNDEAEKLRKLLEKCNYEEKTQQPYENLDEDNRKILERGTDYYNNNCCSDDEEMEKKDEIEKKEEKEEKEEEEEEKVEKKGKKEKKTRKKTKKNRNEIMDIDETYKEIESSKEVLNKFCLDSLSNDRTFCVTDDNQIVVYKANEDEDSFE